jgi:signal transduction histidine kinase
VARLDWDGAPAFLGSIRDMTELANSRQEAVRAKSLAEERSEELDRLAAQLTEARDRAEQMSRAKSDCLAGMSHEIRTPLSAILRYTHLLLTDASLTPTQRARVGSIESASKPALLEVESRRNTHQPTINIGAMS